MTSAYYSSHHPLFHVIPCSLGMPPRTVSRSPRMSFPFEPILGLISGGSSASPQRGQWRRARYVAPTKKQPENNTSTLRSPSSSSAPSSSRTNPSPPSSRSTTARCPRWLNSPGKTSRQVWHANAKVALNKREHKVPQYVFRPLHMKGKGPMESQTHGSQGLGVDGAAAHRGQEGRRRRRRHRRHVQQHTTLVPWRMWAKITAELCVRLSFY